MHGILPSEIARLVLDYLEASSCPEAARIFLETSPDLQECRRVAATGGRFITRVFGLTLINILHTFCDIYGLVQEKLSRMDDNEQLRRCGDLYEQLRTLIDGCRGQRFFVNINVPAPQLSSQMTTGGSPIITSSIRKRRHSGTTNRDKCQQKFKTNSLNDNENMETSSNSNHQWNENNNIELSSGKKLVNDDQTTNCKEPLSSSRQLSDEIPAQCSSTVTEVVNNVQSSLENESNKRQLLSNNIDNGSIAIQNNDKEKSVNEMENSQPRKLSTGTDTQELMKYSTAEVQTIPYDIIESESETANEPVENLSLLTKELLNRTELQERIAENINKAILPTDGLSLKDLSFSECIAASECNTSIMTELNNAIKSIVTATQSDPVFEKFFDEIFQPDVDGEQSPDEDIRRNIINSNKSPSVESPKAIDELTEKSDSADENKMKIQVPSNDEVSPLTSETETVRITTNALNINSTITAEIAPVTTLAASTTTTTMTMPTNENQSLEDFNAAAIQSIINVNNKLSEEIPMEIGNSSDKQLNCAEYNFPKTNLTNTNVRENYSVPAENCTENEQKLPSEVDSKTNQIKNPSIITKKSMRKTKITRQKLKSIAPIPSKMLTVPTLVVCNKNEPRVHLFNNVDTSHYIPIAPKDSICHVPPPTTLYLRTVNVSTKIPAITTATTITNKYEKENKNSTVPIEKSKEITSNNEAITLYGMNDNNFTEILEPENLPTITLDESISFSGTGLSPFLKFNDKNLPSLTDTSDEIKKKVSEDNTQQIAQISACDITKRTPKSLLKSRSMNHRLSLSTPRRRIGHIRALDFNTPPKELNTSRRLSEADVCPSFPLNTTDNSKSICRTSLFKSPPCETFTTDKQPSSLISRSLDKTQAANSSSAPTLYGEWDKVSGVGTILECVSSTVSVSSSKNNSNSDVVVQKQSQHQQQLKNIKSWDADLRKSLMIPVIETNPRDKLRTRNTKSNTNEIKTALISEKSGNTKKSEIQLKNKLPPIEESNSSICTTKISKTNSITETITVDKKGVAKKYAKLKTLATNIKRIDKNNEHHNVSNINSSGEVSEKSIESLKNLPHISMELETPRKNETTLGIPPTPRVLSPSNSTSFVQVTENSGKVRCFITTPEFPPTPCINITPRQATENTTDIIHSEFSASYFHPSSELKEIINIQSQIEHCNIEGNKPEITQFEVIKENLPKDGACKELNILINSKDTDTLQLTKDKTADEKELRSFNDLKTNKNMENTGSTMSDSSDSETDTSSSSCSSSSCSCNDDTTNNSSRMSTSRTCKGTSKTLEIHSSITNSIPKINDKSDGKVENSYEQQVTQAISSIIVPNDNPNICQGDTAMWKKNESSPEKVFPIVKSQQALDDADIETPAKDETLLSEAEISETPCGSKSGIETLTNLTSKISALINTKELTTRKYNSALRKLDTQLSSENIKTNISVVSSNSAYVNKLDKELIQKNCIDDEKDSNKIVQQCQSEKTFKKSTKIKSKDVSNNECSLKLSEKLNNQNVPRKSKNDVKQTETKITNNRNEIQEDEIGKNTNRDSTRSMTDSPDKFSVDDPLEKSNLPIDSSISNPEIPAISNGIIKVNPSGICKEDASVLESLKLIPASKIEVIENPEVDSTKLPQHSHHEFSFIHDDTVNTKRRNIKKYNSSDLEFAVQLRNDEFVTITATNFEILFTLPSKTARGRQSRKTKIEIKPEIKSTKPTIKSIKIVKGVTVTKNKVSPVASVVSQPLATSSPVHIDVTSKISSKTKLINENVNENVITKLKITKQETKKQSMTTRKRKERTGSKEEPVEKRMTVTNPKLLLSKVNIDEFLTQVHGPVTKS